MNNVLGFQTTIDFYGCNTEKINSTDFIEDVLKKAAKKMNLTVVKSTIHSFYPIGVSGVIVIQESHLAIHTWPEHNYVAIDFFTCNEQYDISKGVTFLKEKFKAKQVEMKEITRGSLNTINSIKMYS